MRKASIRDLHINTSALVREVEEGSTIVIERRGEPVAEIHPISPRKGVSKEKMDQIFAEMEKLWAKMPQLPDSTDIISEDRDR